MIFRFIEIYFSYTFVLSCWQTTGARLVLVRSVERRNGRTKDRREANSNAPIEIPRAHLLAVENDRQTADAGGMLGRGRGDRGVVGSGRREVDPEEQAPVSRRRSHG